MRIAFSAFLIGANLWHSVAGGPINEFNAVVYEYGLPPCSAHCVEEILFNSGCDSNSTACQCSPDLPSIETFGCLLESCPFHEALKAQNSTATICGTQSHLASQTPATAVAVLGALADSLLVTCLIHDKFYSPRKSFAPHNWVMLAMLPGKIVGQLLWIEGLHAHGLGMNVWTLSTHRIAQFAFYLFLEAIIYNSLMTLLKVTFCLFYLSIFSGATIRRVLWGTMAFHIVAGLGFITAVIFTCIPVSFAWEQYSTARRGKCINIEGLYWSWSIMTVLSDIWLLGIPLSQVYHLGLYWKRKLSVIIMFSTGFLVTIVSLIRLKTITAFTQSINKTVDEVGVGLWSDAEVNVGVICICLPCVRLILAKLFPRLGAWQEVY